MSHGVAAASTLEPLELAQLPPSQLPQLGKVARGLTSEGYAPDVVAALCRLLFVTTNPPQVRMALGALDSGRHMSTLEGSEARRLVALLGRLLGGVSVSTAARLATRLDSEAEGGENKEALEALELVDLGEMLCELSVVGTAGGGIVGESLAGLKSLDLAVHLAALTPTPCTLHPHNTSLRALCIILLHPHCLALPSSPSSSPSPHHPHLATLLTAPQVSSKLSPTEMQRVGRIAHRMAGEGYEAPAINLVVRVLLTSPPATLCTQAATLCIHAATPCLPGACALRLHLQA